MSPIVFEGLLYVAVIGFCVYEVVKTRRELRETRAKREAAEREAAEREATAASPTAPAREPPAAP